MPEKRIDRLAAITRQSREDYLASIANPDAAAGWSAVIITASSAHQAQRYEREIEQRRLRGALPPGAEFVVIADPAGRRIGSGGATLHALAQLQSAGRGTQRPEASGAWWNSNRVLMIHSGGDSRRLPQYSLSGKLFSALPVRTAWGETSTVFDELLALSTTWARHMPNGLLISSGDVILVFDAAAVRWDRPGVSGIAMRQPAEVGVRHGVYIAGDGGKVYGFLQKASVAEAQAAGGLLDNGEAAVDTGLIQFDADSSDRLCRLSRSFDPDSTPAIDLYTHFTGALTRQWRPAASEDPVRRELHALLRETPFWCSVVEGEFTHVGTTTLFRRLMAAETDFTRLYAARQRHGVEAPQDVESSGVIVDSFVQSGAVGTGAVVIECLCEGPVRAGRGAVLHGLNGIAGAIEVVDDAVVHQVAVRMADGSRGTVIRVYGVGDDPKVPVDSGGATWFGRPMTAELESLGLPADEVWPDIAGAQRSLWNAALFPVASTDRAWACARWLMGLASDFDAAQWRSARRCSLASSAEWADEKALHELRTARGRRQWENAAVQLAVSGSDLRPMLAQAPGVGSLVAVARRLREHSQVLPEGQLTEAASSAYQASLFFNQAGLEKDAIDAHHAAFGLVARCVALGVPARPDSGPRRWTLSRVDVTAPARVDFGGGWSDTPPFCFDWGGTVFNASVALDGLYPIETRIRRIEAPVIRCLAGGEQAAATYSTAAELMAPPNPGDPFAIPRAALQLSGLFQSDRPLAATLESMGGGIEISTEVRLPIGSGLGTSSILAATVLKALSEMNGAGLSARRLLDEVMQLEQVMGAGGGWQDQAGGIFPGLKVLVSGPGYHQNIRVLPLLWGPEQEEGLQRQVVLASTGITRVARNLLQQVVGKYLARESSALQVLHSIKTLALEMAQAVQGGDWAGLGWLLDRHWELNKTLDPNTTNAPIERMLGAVRPFLHGAKLAGAGGGGFLIMVVRDPSELPAIRAALAAHGARVHDFELARDGLRVKRSP